MRQLLMGMVIGAGLCAYVLGLGLLFGGLR